MIGRVAGQTAASLLTACGAVMLTQAFYDAENASAAFRMMGAIVAACGIMGGAWVAKRW